MTTLFAAVGMAASGGQGFADTLDAALSKALSPDQPGVAVLIARLDGLVLFRKGYGRADLNSREPITPKTVFNTGSISKTFVAYGILKLAERKKLSLEDTLDKYFPDFEHPEIARRVTLAHLLSHTSGLPDLRDTGAQRDYYLTAKDEENFAPLKAAKELRFSPGERFEYSNPAFNGLALIIERLTGDKWQRFIQREVFGPAGMASAKITDGPYPERGVAHGYARTANGWQEDDYGEFPTFAAAGNGGIWASVDDLFLYERAIQSGRFLPTEQIALSRTPFRPANWSSESAPQVGMSWFHRTTPTGANSHYHSGSQGGFRGWHEAIPQRNLTFILLGNAPEPFAQALKIVNDQLDAFKLR
ncbi:MAG: beta-lactamase family protein [Fimbriimonadaceae bacterium]|nr:Penicillin-binding protein 4* [Fimbriimonadaceae bacterium]MCL4285409.1 beta-lactamase family protein [Fimbriimonadaceae bacterium]QOJ11881.1 MAG: beta-lactamase family protein [Chthonomonadaceae bacterium]